MHLFKKILILFVSLSVLLTLAACSWSDVTVTPSGNNPPPSTEDSTTDEPLNSNGTYGLTFDEGLDQYVVTGYHGTEEDVFIPSEWDGKPVTGINSFAFYDNPTVKSITITSSIVSVSKNALVGDYKVFCESTEPQDGWHSEWYDKEELVTWNCGTLGSFSWSTNTKGDIVITGIMGNPKILNIPEKIGSRTVVSIKSRSFMNCETLEKITLPSTLTEIGSFAFQYCTSLKSIVLPESVIRISSYVFDGCTSLEQVKISDKTVFIGTGAFSNCTSLGEIHIPSTVEEIEMMAFHNSENLFIFLDFEEDNLPLGWHSNWNSSGCEVIYIDTIL